YVELPRHQIREEELRNQYLLDLASDLHLPLIATNSVRYASKNDCELLDVFTSILHHTSLDKAGRLLAANSARHLRTAREMSILFRDLPEAIANTRIVSQ